MIEEIISNKARLEQELKIALSTMEKTDRVKEIKEQIKMNQARCPHFDDTGKYNFVHVDNHCPYCGKKME